MQSYKEYQFDEPEHYSLYVHGYWIPWIKQQREMGELKQGQKYLAIGGSKYLYTGEIDELGEACGLGIALGVQDPSWRFEGTFNFDSAHGVCSFSKGSYFRADGEWRRGKMTGKATFTQ